MTYLARVWSMDWPKMWRQLIAAGGKLGQIREITVGQWWTVMQVDGPGSETVTTHTTARSLIKQRNRERARKGLPLLPLPDEKPKGGGRERPQRDKRERTKR